MKKFLVVLASLVIMAVFIGGCTTQPPQTQTPLPTTLPTTLFPSHPTPVSQAPSLAGTSWKLTSYLEANKLWSSLIAGSSITATFGNDGKLTGYAGCNNYNANYQATTIGIWISQPASTLMACSSPTGIMHQESMYFTLLTLATTYTISNDQLTIYDTTGKKILQYARAQPETVPAEGPVPIIGMWELGMYNNLKGAWTSVISGSQVTAGFGADGSLAGSAGCNNYNADYQVTGKNITIATPSSTRMFCATPEGVMEQEDTYFTLLPMANTYSVSGNQLTIFDTTGKKILQYNKAPIPAPT